MKIHQMVNSPGVTQYSAQADVQHPSSLMTSSFLEGLGLNISLSVFPPGPSEQHPHIVLSVFVNGDQHVVFSGNPQEAQEFFKKFPKN